jgi:hypothetical protein
MGTSSIYPGPTKNNPLLPPDYDGNGTDNTNSQEPQSETKQSAPQTTWSTVKSDFSKYINGKSSTSGRSGGSVKNVARQYVRAAGGTKAIMARAISGKHAGKALHGFYNSISSRGIKQTLEDLHIQFQGKSAVQILSQLVNAISPSAVTKEDIVARKATQDALAFVYGYIERNSLDIECLDNMPQELIDKSMCAYVESYIWGLMLKDISSRLEIYEKNPDKAYEIEKELKGYVRGTVEVEFLKDKEIFKKSADEAIDGLMKKCFESVEGLI